jgi:FkbM family methyltransferase
MSSADSMRRAADRLRPRAEAAAQRLGFLRTPVERDSGPRGRASEADVVAAYRMLLGREPDGGGLAGYRRQIAEGTLTRDRLATELLGSPEFARGHPSLIKAGAWSEEIQVAGFSIAVDPSDWAVGATIAAVRRYEPEVTAVIRTLIGPGASFVDVGANIGWFSLLAGSIVGASGTVVAVEPNLRNCELLRASKTANGFEHIDVVAGAASDTTGWLALETDASNGRVIPLGPIDGRSEAIPCSYVVPALTLDQLLGDRQVESVDAMKVDVEGVEARVFAGAERLLSEQHPAIVFEWFPVALRSTVDVEPDVPLDLLRAHGYSITVIGHPSAEAESADQGLTNLEIEAIRTTAGRENLDLLARRRS